VVTVQGKPVARWGRKARDLPREDRPVAVATEIETQRWYPMKAILARFTVAVSLLATMALTLGAGVKWY
jgi:hypothetical protein